MNNTNAANNDEIDLIELIKVLWNKKIWILLSAFVCTLIAGVYAFTAKEQWTSKAVIVEPKSTDIGQYTSLRKEYERISSKQFNDTEVQKNTLEKELFDYFVESAESLDVRKRFFTQSEYYNKLIQDRTEPERQYLLSSLLGKIVVAKPNSKRNVNDTTVAINFSAEDPQDSKGILEEFILFVNTSVMREELINFTSDLSETILDLNYEKSKLEEGLWVQKRVHLNKLKNALDIATRASVKEYSINNNSAIQAIAISENKVPSSDSFFSYNTYLFMLGEKYLKAQIDVLKQNDVIYPARYYEISALLSQLEPLLMKVKEVKANSFSYQASPDYPVVKDKPKKALILVIGCIIGLILSTFIILFGSVIQNSRKEP